MFQHVNSAKLYMTSFVIATAGIALFSTAASAYEDSKTKYGITVTECGFDYDDENFCADSRMKTFAKVMQERPANFAQDRLIYIYKANNLYRLVSMDKNKKIVTPLMWGFQAADKPVNNRGEKMEFIFNKNAEKFCYKGDVFAYRDAYGADDYPQFCFDYDKRTNSFSRF